jgi:CHAT domain-containing protein
VKSPLDFPASIRDLPDQPMGRGVHTLLGPVLKGDPNDRPYAHPYYWAPFVFYGAEEAL